MVEVLLTLFIHLSKTEANLIVETVEIESAKYELDPTLVYSIIAVESRYQVKAIGSSHSERGLMQLNPKYYGQVPLDIQENIKLGIKVLAKKKDVCKNRYGAAWMVCYNGGTGIRLKQPRLFPYYTKVINRYEQIYEILHSRPSTSSASAPSVAKVSKL